MSSARALSGRDPIPELYRGYRLRECFLRRRGPAEEIVRLVSNTGCERQTQFQKTLIA
jgi:hypothetical protein